MPLYTGTHQWFAKIECGGADKVVVKVNSVNVQNHASDMFARALRPKVSLGRSPNIDISTAPTPDSRKLTASEAGNKGPEMPEKPRSPYTCTPVSVSRSKNQRSTNPGSTNSRASPCTAEIHPFKVRMLESDPLDSQILIVFVATELLRVGEC